MLRAAVVQVERSRGRLRHDDGREALALWRGLVAGQWSLVDKFESDGRRYLLAHRNEPHARESHALRRREQQVLELACRGYSNKMIAYELGIAETTVATHLGAVRRKFGCSSRSEVIALARSAGAAR
jgi:DNA-binding NarL/FixJ family response regulator